MEMAEDIDDEQAFNDTLEGIVGEFNEKADGYAKVIAQLKADAESVGTEIKRLQERKEKLLGNADRIKKHLLDAMVATNNTKFSTTLFNFSVHNNPPKVVIDDEALIPTEYKKVKTIEEVDKTALKEFLKSNSCLYAHLEQGQSLTIK